MLNVLHLLNHAGKAGTERYVETLARALNRKQINAFFAFHEPGLLVERMEELNVPVRRIEMTSRFDLKAAKALARLCDEWSIDIIHCHFLREHYLALLAKGYNKRVKVVYTNHLLLENDGLTRFLNRLLDKRQDQIIAVCNKGKAQLMENGWGGGRIRVIFNAVDPAAWAGTRSESTLRAELGIPEDRFVMFNAGRFSAEKGHQFLVDSARLLTEISSVPFTLVLAGDGPLLEETRAQVTRLGLEDHIQFLGFREDMRNLYLGSDLYVSPSQTEALSLTLIEALATGLPVVATDVGGNGDIVNDETACGLLAEYDNPDSMAAALKRMMEEPAFLAQCRQNAPKAVNDRFEIHKWAEETNAVYADAMKR